MGKRVPERGQMVARLNTPAKAFQDLPLALATRLPLNLLGVNSSFVGRASDAEVRPTNSSFKGVSARSIRGDAALRACAGTGLWGGVGLWGDGRAAGGGAI